MLLKQTDEEYESHSWEELKWIVGEFLCQTNHIYNPAKLTLTANNKLDLFKRLPSPHSPKTSRNNTTAS